VSQRKASQRHALARLGAAMAGQQLPRTWGESQHYQGHPDLQGYDSPFDMTPRWVQNNFRGGLEAKRQEVISEQMCWVKGCELPARKDDPDGMCLPHRKNVDSWKREEDA